MSSRVVKAPDGFFGKDTPPATEKPQVPDPSLRIPYSDEIAGGTLDVKDVIQPVYDEINKEYGLKEKQD